MFYSFSYVVSLYFPVFIAKVVSVLKDMILSKEAHQHDIKLKAGITGEYT